jgi:hypothetical protein
MENEEQSQSTGRFTVNQVYLLLGVQQGLKMTEGDYIEQHKTKKKNYTRELGLCGARPVGQLLVARFLSATRRCLAHVASSSSSSPASFVVVLAALPRLALGAAEESPSRSMSTKNDDGACRVAHRSSIGSSRMAAT